MPRATCRVWHRDEIGYSTGDFLTPVVPGARRSGVAPAPMELNRASRSSPDSVSPRPANPARPPNDSQRAEFQSFPARLRAHSAPRLGTRRRSLRDALVSRKPPARRGQKVAKELRKSASSRRNWCSGYLPPQRRLAPAEPAPMRLPVPQTNGATKLLARCELRRPRAPIEAWVFRTAREQPRKPRLLRSGAGGRTSPSPRRPS